RWPATSFALLRTLQYSPPPRLATLKSRLWRRMKTRLQSSGEGRFLPRIVAFQRNWHNLTVHSTFFDLWHPTLRLQLSLSSTVRGLLVGETGMRHPWANSHCQSNRPRVEALRRMTPCHSRRHRRHLR